MGERRGTKALELWCRRMTEGYPGVEVVNMTTSWRDGLAFCAMIHHFRPELIDFDKLSKSDVYYNNALAFTTAEKYLGIPALLDADDMAAYEVPDRLSILTYLSQFYQAFAAQDAHNRLKRTSSSATDKTQITKPSGPPSKMAHVVGVPKRDPCRKCQLPVFLAERLMVGKKVYHRTCLKCARCSFQLTPGSFYETEVDDQYCCETCPDEEVTPIDGELAEGVEGDAETSNVELRNHFESKSTLLPSATRSVRSSIKERLAFFEKQQEDDTDTKLLQKSLSDEEKTKSLKRMEGSAVDSAPAGAAAATITYKTNPAFSSFLYDTVDNAPEDEEDQSEPSSSLLNSKIATSDSEDEDTDDLTNVSLPPELPKSLPPPEQSTTPHKRFTASAQLVLGSKDQIETDVTETEPDTDAHKVTADEQQNIITETQKTELQINLSSSESNDKTNNNLNDDEDTTIYPCLESEDIGGHQTQENYQLQQIKVENNLDFSETNVNDCVTKDKASVEVTMVNETEAAQQLESIKTIEEITKLSEPVGIKASETNIEMCEPTEEEENIELRTKTKEKTQTPSDDQETTERLSVVRARLQQFEDITNIEKEEHLQSPAQTNISSEVEIGICLANDIPTLINNEHVTVDVTSSRLDENTSPENETEIEVDILKSNELNANEVPLTMETKDNEILENKLVEKEEEDEDEQQQQQQSQQTEDTTTTIEEFSTPQITTGKIVIEVYPEDRNPFSSDQKEDEDTNKENVQLRNSKTSIKMDNLNPFDSSDDEIELEKSQVSTTSISSTSKVPPPRPPPPRISKNPFGSDDDEEDLASQNFPRGSSHTSSHSKRTPVPTPRSNISQSQNPTPEPTPRLSTKNSNSTNATPLNTSSSYILQNCSDFYGSANSLHSNQTTPHNLLRNADVRSSNNSLNLSAGGTIRSRKSRRAPLPPAPVKELFPSSETINSSSKTSTPSSSTVGTPKSSRKKRLAPAPPKPARLEPSQVPQIQVATDDTHPKNLNSYPLQSELDSKLSDEEKALLEGKILLSLHSNDSDLTLSPSSRRSSKRLIPLDKELLEEHGSRQYVEENISQCDDLKQQNQQKSTGHDEEASVVYRRLLMPHNLDTPTHENNPLVDNLSSSAALVGERQLEKLKDNKEANNRNRQSQISAASSGAEDNDPLFNKSAHGKWKRRKGPAPALPIPPRKVLQMLPLQEIKHELEIIEVQQQGLEKQGVILEKMIRDRCEGENGEPLNANGVPDDAASSGSTCGENSKEVEYLILQLFELVNEKNELFRRQAELMYLRRQHRLEQEQADLEYEIRILMAQPERNKTDSDKAREEALIERLVEVVQLRNEVVECLEMDRIREAEEDHSIKQHLESHIAKREDEADTKKSSIKLSKKEKKKQKEAKKLIKTKKLDADKDADESELNAEKLKSKKKKKIFIF